MQSQQTDSTIQRSSDPRIKRIRWIANYVLVSDFAVVLAFWFWRDTFLGEGPDTDLIAGLTSVVMAVSGVGAYIFFTKLLNAKVNK